MPCPRPWWGTLCHCPPPVPPHSPDIDSPPSYWPSQRAVALPVASEGLRWGTPGEPRVTTDPLTSRTPPNVCPTRRSQRPIPTSARAADGRPSTADRGRPGGRRLGRRGSVSGIGLLLVGDDVQLAPLHDVASGLASARRSLPVLGSTATTRKARGVAGGRQECAAVAPRARGPC